MITYYIHCIKSLSTGGTSQNCCCHQRRRRGKGCRTVGSSFRRERWRVGGVEKDRSSGGYRVPDVTIQKHCLSAIWSANVAGTTSVIRHTSYSNWLFNPDCEIIQEVCGYFQQRENVWMLAMTMSSYGQVVVFSDVWHWFCVW